jgi:hypothetical protein
MSTLCHARCLGPTSPSPFFAQIEIEPNGPPFCDSGDSGSIVLVGSNLAVGLLFSKSLPTESAYANPIGWCFTIFRSNWGNRDSLSSRVVAKRTGEPEEQLMRATATTAFSSRARGGAP